jgi:hypothetical protein
MELVGHRVVLSTSEGRRRGGRKRERQKRGKRERREGGRQKVVLWKLYRGKAESWLKQE